jgi:inner membrane protein
MNQVNHIAGGLVFTGILSSFWNINIFDSSTTLAVACLGCLIPDIDHPRGVIGRVFYPIAWWLNRAVGHRTATHSLLFLILSTAVVATIANILECTTPYWIIWIWAVLSHYLLDMITIQGIPLFWPFARNPCVIPGSPDLRIRGNDRRAEVIGFAIFLLLGLTLHDLFSYGFWTSYNRFFGNLKHIHTERLNSSTLVLVEYDFTKNNQRAQGQAYLVNSDYNWSLLFDPVHKRVIRLDRQDPSLTLHKVRPSRTTIPYVVAETTFTSIPLSELNQLLQGKIVSGKVQLSKDVQWRIGNIQHSGSLLTVSDEYNLTLAPWTEQDTLKLHDQLERKQLELGRSRESYDLSHADHYARLAELNSLNDQLITQQDLYTREQLTQRRNELRRIVQREPPIPPFSPDPVLLAEIQQLQRSLHAPPKPLATGTLHYPVLMQSRP